MNSIATYKESLSRITNEVLDDDEELDIPQSRRDGSPASGRRISHRSSRFARPMAGFGSPDEASADRSPSTPQKNFRPGNHLTKTSITKQDGLSNGSMPAVTFDATLQKVADSQGNEASYESEIKKLKAQLDSERESVSTIKLKLQEECQLKEFSQKELQEMKIEKEKTFNEMKELQKELGEKIVELKQLQVELSRRDKEEWNETLENFKNAISVLEKENAQLKTEKNELESNLKLHMKSASESRSANDQNFLNENTSKLNERAIETMELSMQKMEKTLEDTCKERDRALQELNRLKQHLLEKELEDSDKMDEDNKTIEELRATTEYQRIKILQLENALKQEVAKQEEIKTSKSEELQKSNETISNLKQKLASCASMINSKNIELQNLQTVLGQYYAESEAKERLGRDLAVAREESAKHFDSLKTANQVLEMSKREKEEMIVKLSHAERMLADGKRSIQKLEEDNSKLRRALEQNMTRLNRMSLDSDNYVDRRIVIKLLVTYFQRNHSKEVLDLMVRMLGFSEEDKQRIGLAQNAAGRGDVRGVLGLPGRLVGGILGGTSSETSSSSSSHSADNQSFADLWVDFLLKETEERERRESAGATRMSSSSQERSSTSSSKPPKAFNYPTLQHSTNSSLPPSQYQHSEHSDSEFATVPLTPSISSSARMSP